MISRRFSNSMALLLVALVQQTSTAEPVFSSSAPYGFRRAESTRITFNGNRLNEPNVRLLSYSKGITLSDYKSENPQNAAAMLHVAEDVPVGLHAVRLVSDRGISALRLIYVGNLPFVDEAEPNDTAAASQPLAAECSVVGRTLVRDEDWFEIDVPEGWPRLCIEAHGIRLGKAFYDPLIELFGPDGELIERCDDTALCRQDPFIVVAKPAAGRYRILIRDTMYRGQGNYSYLLHVGKFPRPEFCSPSGAQEGGDVEVTWLNGELEDFKQLVKVPGSADGRGWLWAEDEHGVSPSPVPFQLGWTTVRETEPNSNHTQANDINWPTVLEGTLSESGDADFYKLTAKKGQVLQFVARSRKEVRSPVDAVITLLNAQGGYIASNDDADGPDATLDHTVAEDGTYFVSVRDFLRRGGPSYRYRLRVASPPKSLRLSLPERSRNQSVTLAVPRNNRMAVLVQSDRVRVGGDVKLQLNGLPEGVSFEAPVLPGNRGRVPVLVTASPDAASAATLSQLDGVCGEADELVSGQFAQRQLLVAGDNNRDMWGYDIDRLAIAVTDAAPFSVELVSPQVPIVQRGVMQLKVKVTRDPEFDAPITIQSLYMPPGLSGKGRVTIPKGEDSIEYALNANDKARLGTPSFVVLAQAPHQGATVEVSSKVVPIEVAAPFVGLNSKSISIARGGSAELKVSATVNTRFDGSATAELLNLPAGVAATLQSFTADQSEIVFPLTAEENARLGRKGGIICRVIVTKNQEPITHMVPVGQVRVDPSPTAVAVGSTR